MAGSAYFVVTACTTVGCDLQLALLSQGDLVGRPIQRAIDQVQEPCLRQGTLPCHLGKDIVGNIPHLGRYGWFWS